MWTPKRKSEEDATPRLPIPTQIVSNGEYLPEPQTPAQKRVEARHVRQRRVLEYVECQRAEAHIQMSQDPYLDAAS